MVIDHALRHLTAAQRADGMSAPSHAFVRSRRRLHAGRPVARYVGNSCQRSASSTACGMSAPRFATPTHPAQPCRPGRISFCGGYPAALLARRPWLTIPAAVDGFPHGEDSARRQHSLGVESAGYAFGRLRGCARVAETCLAGRRSWRGIRPYGAGVSRCGTLTLCHLTPFVWLRTGSNTKFSSRQSQAFVDGCLEAGDCLRSVGYGVCDVRTCSPRSSTGAPRRRRRTTPLSSQVQLHALLLPIDSAKGWALHIGSFSHPDPRSIAHLNRLASGIVPTPTEKGPAISGRAFLCEAKYGERATCTPVDRLHHAPAPHYQLPESTTFTSVPRLLTRPLTAHDCDCIEFSIATNARLAWIQSSWIHRISQST